MSRPGATRVAEQHEHYGGDFQQQSMKAVTKAPSCWCRTLRVERSKALHLLIVRVHTRSRRGCVGSSATPRLVMNMR